MEVVPAPVGRHEQHAARVELERDYRLGVSQEVGHYGVPLLFAVLSILFFIALQTKRFESCFK
jgi:hypothetical protein